MRFQGVFGAALLGSSALHQVLALQSGVEDELVGAELLESRQSQTIAVTGITGNGVQPRLELRTMQQQHPDMFNVFLLGLRSFMQMDQSDPLSYYQIAGIHGRPYVPWDGVGSAPGFGGGYCTHTSNLFLPWHRPYLALLEQQIYEHVQAVAQSFPAGATRNKYVAAAQNWRFPYWDWAAAPCSNCKAFPALISELYTTVTTPTGVQTIVNPLFRYEFHPVSVSDMAYNPFASWDVTKRYPTSWDTNASSQNQLLNPLFTSNQVNFRDRLYNLFTGYSNFSQFGDEAWISSSSTNADSLESLHDSIHSMVGNNGHMSYLDFAAFDPIFWLHHTMIDRSFALWQVVHPDSYVEPLAAVGSTFTYAAGTVNDENSPLSPFFKDTKGTNWTSADVRSTTTFGYTYPELLNNADASSVRAAINKLYGNTASSSTVSKTKRALAGSNVTTEAAESIQNAASTNGSTHQYICNIVSQKFAMNGSYAIYVFLGNVSSNASTALQNAPNLVGTHAVFSNMASDSGVMFDMDLKITGTVPLTTALIQKVSSGELRSLKPADVEIYLRNNLHWRVAMMDGTEVNVAQVPDLSVAVVQAQVNPASYDTEFPQWGPFTALVSVTQNKVGGYSSDYWDNPEDSSSASASSNTASSETASTPAASAPLAGIAPYANGTVSTIVVPQGTAAATGGVSSQLSSPAYTGAAGLKTVSGYAMAFAVGALLL